MLMINIRLKKCVLKLLIPDKAIDGNVDALKIVPDRYKTQEMCDKAINDYANTLSMIMLLFLFLIKFFPKILLC